MSSVIDLCQKKQYWVLRNTEEVVLIFKFNKKLKNKTRRGKLSTLSGIFDPLGFVAIFILQVTKILQRLCEENIKQEEIDETIGKRNLHQLPEIKVDILLVAKRVSVILI